VVQALYPDSFNRQAGRTAIGQMDAQATYAKVILDLKARELKDRLFSYLAPPTLAPHIFAGAQVLVPFGRTGSTAGFVVSVSQSHPPGIKPKEILEIIDSEALFDSRYIEFLNWIAEYYCCPLADVVSAAVPSFLTPRIKRKVRLTASSNRFGHLDDQLASAIVKILQSAKTGSLSTLTLRQRWRKATGGNQAQFYRTLALLKEAMIIERLPENAAVQAPKHIKSVILRSQEAVEARHQRIVDLLVRNGGQMPLKDLIGAARTTRATLQKLVQAQTLTISEHEALRDPLKHLYDRLGDSPVNRLVLSADQQKVYPILSTELSNHLANDNASNGESPRPWLLHGVTGSGKTEIYLRLIENTIKQGRTALLLVPEIGLTPQLANRLTERFGDVVALWHSALSQGERYDTWRRLKSGAIKVLLGARSAVLVDIPNLALIILDEEHDGSYKQTSPNPRYHARVVAIEKARRHGAMVLLGSATPDISTYFEAQKNNQVLNLPNRIFNQAFPSTITVDMRQEFVRGNRSIFSGKLMQALKESLARNEQSILLMNRRGYASHVFCRVCGYVVLCQNCSVALVYHQKPDDHNFSSQSEAKTNQKTGYLACHHCDFRSPMLTDCPSCASQFIKQYGLGTQRVEEELKEQIPEARVLRLDSDTVARRGAHERILGQFAAQEADILIGTQMVAKGLDIERVTLVGVLAADAAFNMPDYRSTERGFQLLTQVSGRAGRGQRQGLVILQTYNADLPALKWSQSQDYQSLYQAELSTRREFDYPPFGQLLRIVIAADDPLVAERTCHQLAEALGHYLAELLPVSSIKILGPAPCLFEKLRGKYRMHLLIKNQAQEKGQKLITSFLSGKRLQEGVLLAVDVDAVDLF
jgi:primosomal protein N' (replication factor Y)